RRTALHRAVIAVLSVLLSPAAMATDRCTIQAELVTAEGAVEIRRENESVWQPARLPAAVCAGDTIRVLAFSRATLKLADDTLLRLDANSTLSLEQGDEEADTLVRLLRGLIHVISRDPRSLKFSTPYVNAGLEGTEFLIAADESRTAVTVLEGEVVMTNGAGQAYVQPGQQGVASAGTAPQAAPYSDAIELIRWTSRPSPLLPPPLPPPDQPSGDGTSDSGFFNRRAAARLVRGRLAEAV